jgi:hypothetical protein
LKATITKSTEKDNQKMGEYRIAAKLCFKIDHPLNSGSKKMNYVN